MFHTTGRHTYSYLPQCLRVSYSDNTRPPHACVLCSSPASLHHVPISTDIPSNARWPQWKWIFVCWSLWKWTLSSEGWRIELLCTVEISVRFSHLDLSSETSVFAHLLAILMGHSESSLIFYWTHGTSPSSNMQYVHDELLSWLHFNDWKYPPFNALQDLNAKHTYKQTFRITNCIISKFFGVIFCSAALLRVELF